VRSASFRPIFKIFFWVLLADCVMLTYLGGKPPEGIYVILSRLGTLYYFFHFLILLPGLSIFETPKPLPRSISQPILGSGSAGPSKENS
jgi:ubiquinol-cytochrome c reductase cytochrome b subunit